MAEVAEKKNSGYGKRPLWQWIVIYLVVGGILYAGVYYFFLAKKGGYNYNQQGQYQTQPYVQKQIDTSTGNPNQVMQPTQASITLTANGFSPATLTIKLGAKVTWANKSGSAATVNSNPHPVHTAYQPLNLGNFSDGGTLSLTFDKPGTYGYHNHLNPSQSGTIVVQ